MAGVLFTREAADRIAAATLRVEAGVGWRAPEMGRVASAEYTALTTSGTPDGDGYYDAVIVLHDGEAATWESFDPVKLLAANGEDLVDDTYYDCKPAGRTSGGQELFVTVNAPAAAPADTYPYVFTVENLANGAGGTTINVPWDDVDVTVSIVWTTADSLVSITPAAGWSSLVSSTEWDTTNHRFLWIGYKLNPGASGTAAFTLGASGTARSLSVNIKRGGTPNTSSGGLTTGNDATPTWAVSSIDHDSLLISFLLARTNFYADGANGTPLTPEQPLSASDHINFPELKVWFRHRAVFFGQTGSLTGRMAVTLPGVSRWATYFARVPAG